MESDTAIVKTGQIDLKALEIDKGKDFGKRLGEFYKLVMQENTDYGRVPGSQKPSLWKPGAELLAGMFKLSPVTTITKEVEIIDQQQGGPYFMYRVHCRLLTQDGGVVGDGWGSANSKEPGVAFRWAWESELSDEQRAMKDQLQHRPTRNNSVQYRIETPPNEIFMQANAILKKAKKRAFVDAILTVTGASRIFTQDIEDYDAASQAKDITAEAKVKDLSDVVQALHPWLEDREVEVKENDDFTEVKVVKKLAPEAAKRLGELMETFKAKKSLLGNDLIYTVAK